MLFSGALFQLPTLLSLLRGALGLVLPFLLLASNPYWHLAALFIYIFAAFTDYLDGYLARKFDMVSDIGKVMDPTMDKVLILAPLAVFVHLRLFSVWWVVPIFAREIIVTFCRIGLLRGGKAVAAEPLAKIKFGFQTVLVGVSVGVLMAEGFNSLAFLTLTLHIVMMVTLVVSFVLTIITGINFWTANQRALKTVKFSRYTAAVGVGFIPVAPGTWGSALAIPIILLTAWNAPLYLLTFIYLIFVGHVAVGRLKLKSHQDPSYVVMDEVLGMFLSLFMIPLTLPSVIAGFLIFRLMDILKPVPVRQLEALPGWWGILCDDLGAGVYTWLILVIIFGLR